MHPFFILSICSRETTFLFPVAVITISTVRTTSFNLTTRKPSMLACSAQIGSEESLQRDIMKAIQELENIWQGTAASRPSLSLSTFDGKALQDERDHLAQKCHEAELGDLFERAERYARETLLPLISEQAPRFFGFGVGDPKSDKSPKYFPPLGEISEETNDATIVSERKLDMPPSLANSTLVELDDEINKNGAELSDTADHVADDDIESNSTQTAELETAESQVGESRSSKNILSLLRTDKSRKIIPVTKAAQSAERRNYYTDFSAGNIDEDLRIVNDTENHTFFRKMSDNNCSVPGLKFEFQVNESMEN